MSSKDSHSQEYEVTDRDQIVPVASQGLLISQILERLGALEGTVAELRDENRQKDQRIDELEARLEAHESFDGRERATDRQRITTLETPAPALREETAATTGHKTAARIEDLKAMLKRRRGRAAFSELREEMGLSKSQFSKLARHLDKRIFDIQRHPHKAREKVLVLRQQIGQ